MKRVVFDEEIKRDERTENAVIGFLTKRFDDGIIRFNQVDVWTELPETNEYAAVSHHMYNIIGLLELILLFVYNLYYNSNAAKDIKESPYNISLDISIDFAARKFRLYIHVDEDMYGLTIGKKYKHVIDLIKCVLPIMSKIRFDGEIRFYPEKLFGKVDDFGDYED